MLHPGHSFDSGRMVGGDMLCESLTAVHMLVILTPNTSVVRTRRCSIRSASRDEILYWLDVTLRTRYCHVARDLTFACYLLRIRAPVHRLKSTQYGRYQSNRIERPFRFPSARSRRDAHRSDRLAADRTRHYTVPCPHRHVGSLACALPCHPHPSGAAAARKSQRKSRRAT